MRLKKLNLFHEALTALIFSLLITILLKPWIQLLTYLINIDSLNNIQFLWQAIIIVLSVFIFRISGYIKKVYYSYLLVMSFVLLNIFFVYISGWEPYLFYSLLAVLIPAGYRLASCHSIDRFHFDLAVIIILFIISLALENTLVFSISPGDITLFIFCIIVIATLSHTRQLGKYGYQSSYKLVYIVIGLFFLSIIVISFLFAMIIDNNFLELVVRGISWAYNIFTRLLLLILYPVIRLIAPLMTWLVGIFENMEVDEEQLSPNEGMGEQNSFEIQPENTGKYELPVYVYWGLLIVVISIIIYYMIKKIRRRKMNKTDGLIEERESIFTFRDLKHDLGNLLGSLFRKFDFSKRQGRDYNTDDPVMLIRKVYYSFLLKANQVLLYRKYQTPVEYYRALTGGKNEDIVEMNEREKKNEVKKLTRLYNKARYYQQVSEEDVEYARKIWQDFIEED
ncbi:MAG: hypothetical protein ACOCQN_03290 [Halanaerobiaceae bacterium]